MSAIAKVKADETDAMEGEQIILFIVLVLKEGPGEFNVKFVRKLHGDVKNKLPKVRNHGVGPCMNPEKMGIGSGNEHGADKLFARPQIIATLFTLSLYRYAQKAKST